ncbi:hypothetical protein VPH35_133895 [Triticum aestivum]
MRPLIGKLDMLLLDPPPGCSSTEAMDGTCLLRDEVEKISSYLDDLSELTDPPLKAMCWMNEVRDLSYDMEDYINSLIFVPNNNKTIRTLRELSTHVKPPRTQVIIAETLLEFRMYVQETIERHHRYNLLSCRTLRHRFVSMGPMLLPTAHVVTDDIVIDGRMNEFINSLANDRDQQLKVSCLLGSACLGKTTLAEVLYNKFGKNYSCRAFVRVSKKPDMKRVFHDMLWQIQRQRPSRHCKEVELIDKIKKYLQDKRYLIVIDDVWAASVWDIINHACPKGNHGSRLITTTQVEGVALKCCCYQPEYVLEMKHLDDDHSRKLFFNRLFGSESYCPEEFKEVLNDIVEVCDGLPLAIISIASVLASQPAMPTDLLKYIHQSLNSCFLASERMRQALNLSFNNLPHYLKTCLLYLVMYPEGYIFCNDDLVREWVAEGFIDTMERQDRLKVAERYLNELICRRLIHPIRINHNNEVLSCAVHDVVYDFIASKSAEENFIVSIDCSQKNVILSNKVRRLSLLFGDARYAKTPINIRKSQVRSLAYFGLFNCMPCIRDFKLLRVLNLQLSFHGDSSCDPVDLAGISELIQLKYFKIGCGFYIKLPTDGLKCLQTLDITDVVVIRSSVDIILPKLLHLSLPFARSLLYWNGIKWILGGAGGLNSLEDLHLTVSSTDSNDLERNIKSLGHLIQRHQNLRTVVMTHGSKVKNSVVSSTTKLITTKPSKERPKWAKELDNLVILKIAVKELHMICVDILRELCALTALSLYVRSQGTKKIIFDKHGFSALKYFKLRFTTGVAWINFEKDAMPSLWKLKLIFNAVPRMNLKPYFLWTHSDRHELYKRGDALISIDHMPGLREIYAKFGGAAADVEYIKSKRIGISNDPSNPEINMQWVEDQSRNQKQQMNEILEIDFADVTLDRAAAERSPESVHEFTLDEIMSATSNFANAHFNSDHYKKRNLDKTFCRPGIYKGFFENRKVVVKCFNKFSGDHEWLPQQLFSNQSQQLVDETELECLAMVHDPHLVKLLGFCDYDNHRMLVYADMPTESLKDHLSNDTQGSSSTKRQEEQLPWLTRLRIAIGAAKGLAFLHEADKPMIHGDFKVSNILLGSDRKPKLFGFGFPKDYPGAKTAESDVYNFGVVLLELLAGRSVVDEKRFVMEWSCAYPPFKEDKLIDIIDPSLEGEYSLSAAYSTVEIVSQCLNSMPKERPSMRDVVEALEPLLNLGDNDKAEDVNWEVSSLYPASWDHHHEFQRDELMLATSHFSAENILGKADYGHIYKGAINGKLLVAVMKLHPDYNRHRLKPEGGLLWCFERLRHPHILSLLGYCNQDGHGILVYEHMQRGRLLNHILETNRIGSIPWLSRLKIAVGAAKGLAYLEDERKIYAPLDDERSIYYSGFKASCIMVDSDHTAKLFGFQLVKENPQDKASESDVYNFGLVLLQLLAGGASINEKRLLLKKNPVKWSRSSLNKYNLHRIMDPRLEGQYSFSAASSTATIARRCLQDKERPSMRDVVLALEPLLSDGRHSRAVRWTPSLLLGRYGAVKGRGKAKHGKEVEEPTTGASSVTLPGTLNS